MQSKPEFIFQDSNAAAQDQNLSMLARTGVTDIFGKLDDEIPPIRINGDFLDDVLRRRARASGCNLSEYIRNKLYVAELGIDHVLSLREKQLRDAMGNASQMPSNETPA